MKKLFFVLLFAAVPVFGDCASDTAQVNQRIMQDLNQQARPQSATKAYNALTSYFTAAQGSAPQPSGACNIARQLQLANKLENIQQSLNNSINNNFNGNTQILYNENNPFNEGNPNSVLQKGTDQIGLIKYVYDRAGVNTANMHSLSMDDLARRTEYQVRPNSVLRPGDIIVLNYNNDSSIDTVGLVYHDNATGRLKMLEMGGNPLTQTGSSVKSEIPTSSATSTAYVIPFESLMATSFVPSSSDPAQVGDVERGLMSQGTNFSVPPVTNPNTELSQPRPAGALTDNGYTSSARPVNDLSQGQYLKDMNGITKVMFTYFLTYLGRGRILLLLLMSALFTANIAWKILKELGDLNVETIFNMFLTELAAKSFYFIAVIIYPLVLQNVIIPLFLFKLPTFFLGDFLKVSGVAMENGRYATYFDIMKHVFKKGWKLIVGTFGASMTQQPASIGDLFSYFGTIWKNFSATSKLMSAISAAANPVQGAIEAAKIVYGVVSTVIKIMYTIMQLILFRPLTATLGLMTVMTLINLALDLFMAAMTFIIGATVGMFYLALGTMDLFKSKAWITLRIIITGTIQYLILMAFIIVMSETIELIGKKFAGSILNLTNVYGMIQIFMAINIINTMIRSLAMSIAQNV